jgi:hypothetical protein
MCRGTDDRGAEELRKCQTYDNVERSTQTIDQVQQDEGQEILHDDEDFVPMGENSDPNP